MQSWLVEDIIWCMNVSNIHLSCQDKLLFALFKYVFFTLVMQQLNAGSETWTLQLYKLSLNDSSITIYGLSTEILCSFVVLHYNQVVVVLIFIVYNVLFWLLRSHITIFSLCLVSCKSKNLLCSQENNSNHPRSLLIFLYCQEKPSHNQYKTKKKSPGKKPSVVLVPFHLFQLLCLSEDTFIYYTSSLDLLRCSRYAD
jgi:hypothetical protein